MRRTLLSFVVAIAATAVFVAPATAARKFVYRGDTVTERLAFHKKVIRYDRKALRLLKHDATARHEVKLTNRAVRQTKQQLAVQRRGLRDAQHDYRVWLGAQEAAAATETVTTDSGSATVTAAPPSSYSSVVGIAEQYLGVPYVYGGASPSGFDCSGFVMYVYAQLGVSLPHNAAAQYGYGVPVSLDALQPGDLVFSNGLGHVAIYVGGGNIIHAPSTGGVVEIISMGYMSIDGARRI